MRFPTQFVNEVAEANDIVALISEDSHLKQMGSEYKGLCPFLDHNEKTPSFSVSASKQVYYCFGCQKSGNIYTYLQEQRAMSFPEAVEFLAKRAGKTLPTDSSENFKENKKRASHLKLLKKASDFYHSQLLKQTEKSPVKNYLKSRNINSEMIKDFQLGFAPDSWDGFLSQLSSGEQNLAQELGLIKKSTKNQKMYDSFRKRLIFPIFSLKKETLGFGARALSPNDMPKYINSSDSDIFHKGRIFYGLDLAFKSIRQKGFVYVVEGYTDLLSLHKFGVQNAVATLGTALTNDHARVLTGFTKQVVFSF